MQEQKHIVDTFLPGVGTVRDCLDCGALIAGGPTRCKRCADECRRPVGLRRVASEAIYWGWRLRIVLAHKLLNDAALIKEQCRMIEAGNRWGW